jgi:hypothetical protein
MGDGNAEYEKTFPLVSTKPIGHGFGASKEINHF